MSLVIFALFAILATLSIPLCIWGFYDRYDKLASYYVGLLFSVIPITVLGVMLCFILPLTTGAFPNYSNGTVEGVLVSQAERGVIWKTYECEIQLMGEDQVASYRSVLFSTTDQNHIALLQFLQGKTVKVNYNEWFVMPYRMGESNKEVVEVYSGGEI